MYVCICVCGCVCVCVGLCFKELAKPGKAKVLDAWRIDLHCMYVYMYGSGVS
jgi:hypothetical protein